MNLYKIFNIIYHFTVIPIWILNVLCVLHNGWFSSWGINLLVSIILPIVYSYYWYIMYLIYRQPTFIKTIWFIIKNK